jgi:hypothetical protein
MSKLDETNAKLKLLEQGWQWEIKLHQKLMLTSSEIEKNCHGLV